MCQTKLQNFLAELPKCEHHLHLDRCLTLGLLIRLATKNGISLPGSKEKPEYASLKALDEGYKSFSCLREFLDCYYLAINVVIHASDFEMLAWSYFTIAHGHNVHHAEVFFDPQSHTDRGIPLSTVMEGFTRARQRAEAEFGMTTKLNMCFLRHLLPTSATETFSQAVSQNLSQNGMITGIGLDSTEVGFKNDTFKEGYIMAEKSGIRRTAHAGEECGPENIQASLEVLGCERIDY